MCQGNALIIISVFLGLEWNMVLRDLPVAGMDNDIFTRFCSYEQVGYDQADQFD